MGSAQLPHLNIEDNPDKPNKKKLFLIAVFSFLLLSLPVGVYLLQQQQQLSSKASNDPPLELEKSISLLSPTQVVGIGQVIPVDVVIKSDNQFVNLASVKLQFNPSKIKVVELITNTSQSQNKVFFGKYWLSKGYDNEKGEVSLIAGVPKPGIQTSPGNQTFLLAQVRFVTLVEGAGEITISPSAKLVANSDNRSIQFSKTGLNLTIQKDAALPKAEGSQVFSGQLLPRFVEMQPSSAVKDQISLSSPKAGDVFFYFRPVELLWNGATQQIKSLVLYLNGEPYGVVAENLPNNSAYTWTPSLSVPLTMIVPENSYSFQIISQTRDGKEAKSDPSAPFGIISDPNGKVISSQSAQLKQTDQLTTDSSSQMLSRWGEKLTAEEDLDLNGDLVINYLDWYLLRRALFVKDLVY